MVVVEKGTRVLVRMMKVKQPGTWTWALPGVQPTLDAEAEKFDAVITGIFGDDAVAPARTELTVRKDDGTELRINSKHVVGVYKS